MADDTLIFVDDGFFGLVKKYFQKEDGKNKKYLQTFRNICKKEKLNLKHVFIYTCPPYQSPNQNKQENFLMSRYNNMVKMLKKKKWVTLREGRCQRILNEQGGFEYCQKGVDALVILDMYDIKENYPDIKKIILIASDSDFAPVIERMKQKCARCGEKKRCILAGFGREKELVCFDCLDEKIEDFQV